MVEQKTSKSAVQFRFWVMKKNKNRLNINNQDYNVCLYTSYGSCRMCLVEIQESSKPVVSYAMPIAKARTIVAMTTAIAAKPDTLGGVGTPTTMNTMLNSVITNPGYTALALLSLVGVGYLVYKWYFSEPCVEPGSPPVATPIDSVEPIEPSTTPGEPIGGPTIPEMPEPGEGPILNPKG